MKTSGPVVSDERTVAVENAGHRWGLVVVICGLFIDIAYRGVIRHEAAWDLLALAVAGGFVCTVYKARQKALPHGWGRDVLIIVLIGGVISAVLAFIVAFIVARMRLS